jgi:hypothetical protein
LLRGFQASAPPGKTILLGHERRDLMQINMKRPWPRGVRRPARGW